MTCKDVGTMLDRLMDGELTEGERRELEAHGQTCPDCADEIRAAFEMKALFEDALPEADVPLAAQAKWRGAIREAAKADRRRRLMRWISSAAAAVVVLVGVGLALNGSLAPKKDAASPYAVMEAAEAPAPEEPGEAAADESAEAEEAAVENREAAFETGGAAEADAAMESANEAAVIETDGASALMGPVEAPVGNYAAKSAAMDMDAEAAYDAEADMGAGEACDAEEAVEAEEDAAVAAPEAFEGVSATMEPMCAALAQQSPACEYAIQTRSVDVACELIRDLAGEFEGTADVQSVEGGSANVYVELDARYAAEFLSGVAKLDDSPNPADPPELSDNGVVLVLLVVEPLQG